MSYILGSITLPTPSTFNRVPLDRQTINLLFNGTTRRNIVNKKEQFTLQFMHLTQTEVQQILSEFNQNAVRDFQVTEENLEIGPTPVHIDLDTREYANKGPSYREDLTLILTEVI